MSLIHIKGDLFAANERAIAHGCNCHGVMGAGVAKIVRDRYGDAHDFYRMSCQFGQFYPGVAQPTVCVEEGGERTTVYNLATQNAPGANACLDFVEAAFDNMRRHMEYVGNSRNAMPKIGAGIGGLDWDDVEQAALRILDGLTVVVYSL
jgi:O-acetyl-ADP-ribose deacetylase (regulator of RNase III)